MLEEILKEMNKNLERIAIALNSSTIEVDSSKVAIATTSAVQQDAEIPQVAQPQIQQPVATTTVIPTAEPTGYTQEQLAVAMSNAVSAGKMNLIQEIMAQFGVQALTQLDTSRYNELAVKLKESGVQI